MEEDGWKRKENLAGGYHTSAPFSHENYNCLYFLIFYNNLIFRILLSEANIQKYHFSQVSSSLSRLYNNWIISLSLSHCHTLPITMHITNSRVLIFFKKGQPSASCVKIELLHCVISEPSLLTVNLFGSRSEPSLLIVNLFGSRSRTADKTYYYLFSFFFLLLLPMGEKHLCALEGVK